MTARTREYSEEFIMKLREQIEWYFTYYYPDEKIVTTDISFASLGNDVNDYYQKLTGSKNDVISYRYIRDIYFAYEKNEKKIAARVDALKGYLDWLQNNKGAKKITARKKAEVEESIDELLVEVPIESSIPVQSEVIESKDERDSQTDISKVEIEQQIDEPYEHKDSETTGTKLGENESQIPRIKVSKPFAFIFALFIVLLFLCLYLYNNQYGVHKAKNEKDTTNTRLLNVSSVPIKHDSDTSPVNNVVEAGKKQRDSTEKSDSQHTPKLKGQAETISIGKQIWMAKNLDVDHYQDGTKIPEAKNDKEWIEYGNRKIGCWCYYENIKANGVVIGKLYNWFAAMDTVHGGLFNSSWRLPTADDIEELVEQLGVESKYRSYLHPSYWPNAIHFKKNKWSILGGCRTSEGQFTSKNKHGYWWIRIKQIETWEGYPFVLLNNSTPNIRSYYQSCGFSVRGIHN